MPNTSAYKSKSARNKALASYNALLKQWPVPYTERLLETSFGQTYALIATNKESDKPA